MSSENTSYDGKSWKYNVHNRMRDLAKRKEKKMFEEDVYWQEQIWADIMRDFGNKFDNLNRNLHMFDLISGKKHSLLDKSSGSGAKWQEVLQSTFEDTDIQKGLLKDLFGGESKFWHKAIEGILKGSLVKHNVFDPTTQPGRDINRGKYLFYEADVDQKNKEFARKIENLRKNVFNELIPESMMQERADDWFREMTEDPTKFEDRYAFNEYWGDI